MIRQQFDNRASRLEAYFALAKERPQEFCKSGDLDIVLNREAIQEYEDDTGKQIGILYSSDFHLLIVDLVESGGKRFAYERVLPANTGAPVVIVPLLDQKLVLLEQFRHALRRRQLSFPRGFGEEGIAPENNARKELWEELGAQATDLTFIGQICPDSGFTGTVASVFVAHIEEVDIGPGNEGITGYMAIDESSLDELVANDKLDDGFTLAALALYKAHRNSAASSLMA